MKVGLVGAVLLGAYALLSAVMPASAVASGGAIEHFVAHLDGGQEVPPHAVPGTGSGSVKLNAAETMITVDLRWSHLTGNALAAHIHGPAAPGANAVVLFPFAGVPAATKGHIPQQSFAVTPAQVADLEAGMYYFNIHTPANPGGEIRGQILINPRPEHFKAHLTGLQETPPHAVAARGFGSVRLNADKTMITVDLRWSDLTGPAGAAHIHSSTGPGVAGPIVFPFTGVPAATEGHIPQQSFNITPAQVAQLEAGLLYFNVHTTLFPGGEIRGQIGLVDGS